jgi:hypothetical protein
MPNRFFFALAASLSVLAPTRAAEPAAAPLRASVSRAIDALRTSKRTLADRFVVPEKDLLAPFCDQLIALQQEVGIVEYELRNLLEEMDKLPRNLYDKETPRWRAKHDYVRARLERRIMHLGNYNHALARLRREVRDPGTKGGWQLVAVKGMPEDREVWKLARESEKRLERLAEEHKGSPWEIIARRELQAPTKLQWVRVEK